MPTPTSITAMIVAMVTGGGLLAGCASPGPVITPSPAATSATSTGQYNQADVAYMQGMVPQHTQALAMAHLAPSRAASLQVKALATQIQAEENTQIQQINHLLTSWGAATPVTTTGIPGAPAPLPGLPSPTQMRQLTAATGLAFDRLFLHMMISQEQGAVTMSVTELDQATSPTARELAQQTITTEQAHIATMQTLLHHPRHNQ